MTKKNNQKSIKLNEANTSIDLSKFNNVLLTFLAISITILLFFRGGYFEKELLPNLIFIYLIFCVFLFFNKSNKDFKLFDNPVDYLLFGMVIMYLISMTYGVNKRASLLEFSKYLGFFAVYIMSKNFSSQDKKERIIIDVILLGGFVVSLMGYGALIGTWEIGGAITGGRLSSTFQYPNTLAAYVASLYFLSITVLINIDCKWRKFIYGSFMGTFLFTLILTYSRAMWVMLPISIILYFIIIPSGRKLETFLYMIFSAALSIPSAFLLGRLINSQNSTLWIYFMIASLGTGLLVLLVSLGDKKYREVPVKKLFIVLMILAAVSITALLYIVNQTTEVTLENSTDEAMTTSLSRNVSNTMSSTSYELELNYVGEKESEDQYIGTIYINNIDSKSDSKNLTSKNITSISGNEVISFITEEDSVGITVIIQNSLPHTSITINSANIIDSSTGETIYEIPLKYKYIPENIVRRFNSIGVGENSFVARMRFNIDGFKIVRNYPIFGAGGGGWVSLYQKYQSHSYWTTLAHNYFLQLWIEIGTVGFLLLMNVLVLICVYAFKTYRRSDEIMSNVYIAGIFVTVVTMLMHAFVDFDMSLGSYALIFWCLMGLLVSKIDFNQTKKISIIKRLELINFKPFLYLLTLIYIIFSVNSARILYSAKYLQLGAEANDAQNVDGLIENYEKAAKLDSLKSTIKIDLANAYRFRFGLNENTSDIQRAIELVEQYIKLDPYNTINTAYAAQFYTSIGQFDRGLELIDKSVELQPMRTENYIQFVDGYLSVFGYYYDQGDYNSAKVILQKALTAKELIKDVNQRAFKPLATNDELVERIGKAEFMLKNYDILDEVNGAFNDINFAYYFNLDINNDGNPDMLKTSIPKDSKFKYEIISEDEENYLKLTNEGEIYGFNYIHPLKLNPSSNYTLVFSARGTTKPETFRAYAWSNGAAEPNQGGLEIIPLTSEWTTFTLDFTTDADVQPGNQYIRLQHSGNDDGYIEIKDVVILELSN